MSRNDKPTRAEKRDAKRTDKQVDEALRDNGPGDKALAQAVYGKRGGRR